MREDAELPFLPDVITVKRAADALGLSERMVHTYIHDGRLPGYKVGKITAIRVHDFEIFQRAQKGRSRTRLPVWRRSVGDNLQYVSFMQATIRPGMSQEFEKRLETFRMQGMYMLPGTVGRYIARGVNNPSEVQVILIWRSTVMPQEEERVEALRTLKAELADIVDWDNAHDIYGKVLLHT